MGILHPGITQSELVLRTDLGRRLTITEMDGNFVYLEDLILTSGGGGGTGSGIPGTSGTSGTSGIGVPAGGSPGQILAKASGDDFDTVWVDNSGGGGGANGTSGINGTSGTSGISGSSGTSGTSADLKVVKSIVQFGSFDFSILSDSAPYLEFGTYSQNYDNQSFAINLPWDIQFLGTTYSSIFVNSNSYLTFGGTSSAENSITPALVGFPSIMVAAGNNSMQLLSYGFDPEDPENVFRIRYEGSNDTSGFPFIPSISWELIFNYNTPTEIKLVVGDNVRNPGAVYGIADGQNWVERFFSLPIYDEASNAPLNSIDIFSRKESSPDYSETVGSVKFIGPGVYSYPQGSALAINIDPLGRYGLAANFDTAGTGTSVLASTRSELRLTTGKDGSAIRVRPRGILYLQPYNRNVNQPGAGFDVRITASNAAPDGDGIGDYDGGNVVLTPGNGAGTGNKGGIQLNGPLARGAGFIDYYAGPLVSFEKTNYGSEVDLIGPSMSITRGDNQGIYNPDLEPGWDSQNGDPDGRKSPKNTMWNAIGWADLTNLKDRTYTTFWTAVGGSFGNNVLAPLFIMHDTVNDKYYKIDFTVWGSANIGAPVSYTRQQVDGTTGDEIGPLVTFAKPGYADPFTIYDDIDAGLKISRGSNQGIFNIELETSFNNNWPGDGDGENSPAGTLWNLEGWDDLSDVAGRTYKPLVEAFNWGLGEKIVGTKCVMKDLINDRYYAIKFTSWTGAGNGGGFSYTRQLINTEIYFSHSEGGEEVDILIEDDGSGSGVGITRGYNGAIYNPYRENQWDDTISPGGTLWNLDGWDDLSDLFDRKYVTFYEVFNFGGIGYKIVGAELIMKVEDGRYYKVKFLSWQQGGGGAFSYVKHLIDLSKPLLEGIRFSDGSMLKSANNPVKYRASVGRSIQEWYGNSTIDIEQAREYTYDGYSWGNRVDTSYLYLGMTGSNLFNDLVDRKVWNLSVSLDDGSSWKPVLCYGGGAINGSEGYYVYLEHANGSGYAGFTIASGSPIKLRYYRGGKPVVWFDPRKSPNGIANLRGATIEYHAYSQDDGTMVGQIILARDSSDSNVTHQESTSGGSGLNCIDLWHVESYNDLYPEGTLAAWRTDASPDTIKIQWKATLFYGTEFWD